MWSEVKWSGTSLAFSTNEETKETMLWYYFALVFSSIHLGSLPKFEDVRTHDYYQSLVSYGQAIITNPSYLVDLDEAFMLSSWFKGQNYATLHNLVKVDTADRQLPSQGELWEALWEALWRRIFCSFIISYYSGEMAMHNTRMRRI